MKTTKNIALIKFIFLLFLGLVVVPLQATTTLNASQTALRVKPLATMTHLTDDVAGYTKLASIAGDDIYIIENGIAKRKTLEIYKNAEGVLAWRALAQHPNWVEVFDIRNIVTAKTPHVLRIDINTSNTGFTGCHSKIALDDYISYHPNSTFEFRNKVIDTSNNGVYEAKPILILENGTELGKVNNGGISSFFPNNWDEAKILDEVEFAITNNHGKIPSKPNGNEYYGFSTDGTVEIHFYLKQDGTLGSYFPVKN